MIVTSDIPACKHYIKTHTCIQALHQNTHTCIHALQARHQRMHLHKIITTQRHLQIRIYHVHESITSEHTHAYTHCIRAWHLHTIITSEYIYMHTIITSTYMSSHHIRTHPHSSNHTTVQSFPLFTPNNNHCLQHTQEDIKKTPSPYQLLYLQMCTCNIVSQVISSDINSIPQEEMQYLCTHAFTPMQSFHFTMYSCVSTFTSPCILVFLLSLHHVLFCF